MMDRVLIIRSETGGPSQKYAVIVDEEMPVYFNDIRVAADWLKERVEEGRVVR